MACFRTKRVYDPPAEDDGSRVLVDRVWPRGLKKADAAIDHWLKDVAPSTALRKWYGHDPKKWEAFCRRYAVELDEKGEQVEFLRKSARERRVTLLFGAKETARNNATALKRYLDREPATGT